MASKFDIFLKKIREKDSGSWGWAPTDASYITRKTESWLDSEFSLWTLTNWILKQTVTDWVSTPAIAEAWVDYLEPWITTADISDSTDKRYVTDADLILLSNTSWSNTWDQIISDETISISDVTDNNATTSAHWFLPKLDWSSWKYLAWDWTWVSLPVSSWRLFDMWSFMGSLTIWPMQAQVWYTSWTITNCRYTIEDAPSWSSATFNIFKNDSTVTTNSIFTSDSNVTIPAKSTSATRARSSNVATITTWSAHWLATWDIIKISWLSWIWYNTSWAQITVTDTTTFTYSNTWSDEWSTADTWWTISIISREITTIDNWSITEWNLIIPKITSIWSTTPWWYLTITLS